MSDFSLSENYSFNHPGCDSDGESSMSFTDASDLSDSRKRPLQRRKARIFRGYITTDQLHADSYSAGALEGGLENEGSYPKLKSLLLANWARV